MRTLTLLRLILRTLREIKADRAQLATELQSLNATANQLLLIQAKQAHYFPSTPSPEEQRTKTLDASPFTFVEVENARFRLEQKLGREPMENELLVELGDMLFTK